MPVNAVGRQRGWREAGRRLLFRAHGASRRQTSRNRRSRRGGILAGLAAACASQGDPSAGEQGRVARVLDGDALALDTGLRVRLVEVESPRYDGWALRMWRFSSDRACARQAGSIRARLHQEASR